MSEMIATANATRACAKIPPDTGYPVSGGSVILRLYGGSAQRLLFGERLAPDLNGLELGHPAVRFKLDVYKRQDLYRCTNPKVRKYAK